MDSAPLPWLLEPENPSARYLALTGLLDHPDGEPEAETARGAIPGWGPARAILDAQWPGGYWMQPGRGYSPKHKATVWQILFLAAMGSPRTEAIDRACRYVLEHGRLPDGRFSAWKSARGAIACLNGNLLRAFSQLGYEDPRLGQSVEALAQMVLRDRFCCRFGVSPAPERMADAPPCLWGAIKALAAFAEIPLAKRSGQVQKAIEAGVRFLLEANLVEGISPAGTVPNPLWLRFGFPLTYTSDLLEALDVLSRLDVSQEPQIGTALEIVQQKRHESGTWVLEHTPENTWASFGEIGQPNKWVTLRALRTLKGWRIDENRDSVGRSR